MPPVTNSSRSSSTKTPRSGAMGYLDAARKQIPSEPFYKIGPVALLVFILIGTLLVPTMVSCSPDWNNIFSTFGLEKRIHVIG